MATKSTKHDVERFDKWSSTYENSWLQRKFFSHVHEAILNIAERDGTPESVLDVGCGTGMLLRVANPRWPEANLIGIDPANGMIESARRLTPGATFYIGTAEALPLVDSSIDLALSTASFHHWHNQAAGIREVARVLRPGGRFLLADAVLPDWLTKLTRQHRFLSLEQRQVLFEQAGLRVLAQEQARWIVITIARREEN
jgi:ubiquinone/menaquinone biosynthesis C-methylase UbiE